MRKFIKDNWPAIPIGIYAIGVPIAFGFTMAKLASPSAFVPAMFVAGSWPVCLLVWLGISLA